MPLRCFDSVTEDSVHAFDLSPEAWRALNVANKRERHLRMPCCSSAVVLKRSARGTQFFAHKAIGACTTAPESEAHLRLKRMAVEAAREQGWEASAEVAGVTQSGEQWRADVLAVKDGRKVAVEIQWSPQTNEETLRRQTRYAEAGVEGVWLLRQRRIPIDATLPAAGIDGDLEHGFAARVPTGRGEQVVSMEEFLTAAFAGRLRYGIPIGVSGRVSARSGNLFCWSCGAETHIITGIDVQLGGRKYEYTVPALDDLPDLYDAMRSALPENPLFSGIKLRRSRTQGRSYLSNGCAHCDALIGEFHEHEAWYDESTVCEALIRIDEQWRRMILCSTDTTDYEWAGWSVYSD